jgi:HAD superfamily, subfamily IIIB (Acid phosphatase)
MRTLTVMAAAAAVLLGGMVGAAGSAAAQAAPSKSTWLAGVSAALKGDTAYIDEKHAVAKPAIVLDIDNTALESYYQPFAPTPPVLALEKRAVQDGYKVLIATGRSADSGGTLQQLTKAGYHVDQLCFRDPKASSVQASKTACRAKWTAAGYGIIANIGNHPTDLAGGNSGKQYLLPNYGFLD